MPKELKTIIKDLVDKLNSSTYEVDIDEDIYYILEYHLQQSFLEASFKLGTKDSYEKTFAISREATNMFFNNLIELSEKL